MARDTRSDRRARREAQNGAPEAASSRTPAHPASPPERRRRTSFVAESWAELKKVDWPGQSQVIQGTAVVLIACVIVGAFLWVNDLVWKRVVENVFLGQ